MDSSTGGDTPVMDADIIRAGITVEQYRLLFIIGS